MKTILVDDLRSFGDGRACEVARTVDAGVRLLTEARDAREDVELWLDHDMGGISTIWPVIELLESEHFDNIKKIYIHTSNPPGLQRMSDALIRAGYDAERFRDFSLSDHWKWVSPERLEGHWT